MSAYRVWCEDSHRMSTEEADNVEDAALSAHAHAHANDYGGEDEFPGSYRVEESPGVWRRVRVHTRVTVKHNVTAVEACDAPEVSDVE